MFGHFDDNTQTNRVCSDLEPTEEKESGFLKAMPLAVMMAATGVAQAADFTIRATANSNENTRTMTVWLFSKTMLKVHRTVPLLLVVHRHTALSKGAECLQGVTTDPSMCILTSGGVSCIFPYVQVLDLPYLMADDRVAEHVLSGDFTRTMRQMALEDSGGKIRLMTIGNTGGWRNFANTKRRTRTRRYGWSENPYGCC